MDLEEARRLVYTRVQCLDSANVLKIMGYLLIQDIGEQEMLQLALSSDSVVQAFVAKAKQELGLISQHNHHNQNHQHHNQNQVEQNDGLVGGVKLSNGSIYLGSSNGTSQESGPLAPSMQKQQQHQQGCDGFGSISCVEGAQEHQEQIFAGTKAAPYFTQQQQQHLYEIISMQQLQLGKTSDLTDLLVNPAAPPATTYLERLTRSASSGSIGYEPVNAVNGHPVSPVNGQISASSCSAAGASSSATSSASSSAWKPCLYFARGYCKHGSACRFLHVPGTGRAASQGGGVGSSSNSASDDGQDGQAGDGPVLHAESLEALELELRELLSGRKAPVSIASLPQLYYEKFGKTLQADGYLTESQRHGKAGYSLTKLLARLKNTVALIDRPHGQHAVVLAEEAHKFMAYRGDQGEDLSLLAANPSSRQIYLTFPAESSFSEEDVTTHFSAYGPVQDVRIPYQQKRMFGFVTFTYSETVRTILAEGNPHYICGARVLVKPYKEKGKHAEKKMDQQVKLLQCRSFDRNRHQQAALRYYLQDQALARSLNEEDLAAALQHKLAELHLANVQKRMVESGISHLLASSTSPVIPSYLDNHGQLQMLPKKPEDFINSQPVHVPDPDLQSQLQLNPYNYVLDVLDGDPSEEAKVDSTMQPSSKDQQALPCNLQSDQKKFLAMPCDSSPPTFFAHDIF